MPDDLKITITVKKDSASTLTDVDVQKPVGMNITEVIGWIELAKLDLVKDTTEE